MNSHPSDSESPYPATDEPLTLPTGTVVRVRNLVVFHGHNTRQLTVVIETPTPPDAAGRLADEAREVAQLHQQFADEDRLDGISVVICRTQACLELRERSDERFHFVRAADGGWAAAPPRHHR